MNAPATAGDPTVPAAFIRDLATAMSGTDLFDTLALWIPKVLEADRASIAIAPRPTADVAAVEGLEVLSIGPDLIIERGTVLPVDSSLVGKSYRTQKILRINELREEAAHEAQTLASGGLRSALLSPLVSGGKCFGTLNIASVKPSYYQPGDEALLSSIAALVASFLRIQENADIASITAVTDELTGQLNRRGIIEHLNTVASVEGTTNSVLYVDVDDLKSINDAYGHGIGDRVITIIEQRVSSQFRSHERIGRLGGDEFLIVASGDDDGSAARDLAQRIVTNCTAVIVIGDVTIAPRISVGIATEAAAPDAADRLMADADMAMYAAKRSTGSIAVVDRAMRKRALVSASVDRELTEAMASGALRFDYQPVRSLATGELLGAEALLRWTHPTLGAIPAPIIIERIEATARINAFSQWSIDTIADGLSRIRQQNPAFEHTPLSLNLSPHQLAWDLYPDNHAAALVRNGLRPNDITVEVVESSEILPGEPAAATLRRLADAGVAIALDDFGTGHNSLRYFAMFPVHTIKFDRSLVGLVSAHHESRVILKGLTELAHELGIVTLAEGIETAAEARICGELGVLQGQGWHLGMPMSSAALIDFATEVGTPRRRASATQV